METEIIQELLRKIEEMQSTINDMAHTIASQAKTIEQLNATIAALLEKKNKNSNNSSKPPSSDGLNKKNRSLKQASGKKAGGRRGIRVSTSRSLTTRIWLKSTCPNGAAAAPIGKCAWQMQL